MDNYFAKYLHKGSNLRVPVKTATEEELRSIPVTRTRPTPSAASQQKAPPLARPPPPLDECANSSNHSGPYAPGATTQPQSQSLCTTAAAAHTVAPQLLLEESEEDVIALPVFKKAKADTVAVKVLNDDDDGDELTLLLGSQKAREVRAEDAVLATSPTTTTIAAALPQLPVAADVSRLGWATASATLLESLTKAFRRQFEYELHRSDELFRTFEPFFRDRPLRRIRADTTLHAELSPAPAIDDTTIGAIPGCALRPYQLDGVRFLLQHFHSGMPCILADDMGLGKTAQISSFLHTLKQLHDIPGPHLIVAPLSTLTSWTRELARWAPRLHVVKYHGERQTRMQARRGHHNRHAVYVTTPALLHNDKSFFRKRVWVTVIVDEAHVLKSHDTAVTSTARSLKGCYRVAVTGTPVHNSVREVWSLMSFLYPWLIAGYDPAAQDSMREAQECAKLLRCIMLRRTKTEMELGIPPRIDEPLTSLAPTYVQAHLLTELTTHALEEGGNAHQLRGHLSHQRAVCNHPLTLRLLADEGRAGSAQDDVEARLRSAGIPLDAAHLIDPSAKMGHLDRLLPGLRAEGHRCLIFSNFTSTLDLLEGMCRLRGFSYERLDGTCNRVERELAMLRYNHPASTCFLFLVTTTAGGVGVTLTGADTVILFDAHFNPQLDRQAADRAHRIGQTRTVHVHRLCLTGTVEEHIRSIAARKASLGDFIVDGGGGDGATGESRVTADDIRAMFQALEKQKAATNTTGSGGSTASPTETGGMLSAVNVDGAHAVEDAMVTDLLRVEERGLPGSAAAAAARRGGNGVGLGGLLGVTTDHCFCCGAIMHPMEPLYHCLVCPKAYHADCIGAVRPKPGMSVKKQWVCPRHTCAVCGKAQAADGALFMCTSCPNSICFDCLDPRYLEMDTSGTRLLHVRNTYADMEVEQMESRRSCYYLTCLHCAGVVSSSSSGSSEEDSSAEAEVTNSSDAEEDSSDD